MPETKAQRLAAALDEFISSSPDVEAAAVVSFDGLPMASALPDTMEEDRVGAMSAALLSLGEQAALGLGRGQLNQVFIEGEHGFVFLMSARDQAVLASVARRSAKIGFILFEMRRAADRIGDVLLDSRDFDDTYAAFSDPQPPTDVHAENGRNGSGFDEGALFDRPADPESVPVDHDRDPFRGDDQHASEHDRAATPWS